jgi:lipoyl(octanoyl) transferase
MGLQPYTDVWQQMKDFTDERDESSVDEIWLVEHPPVYTLGQAGKREHLLKPGSIPIVESDRGGQVTYHGPGQLVCYLLFNVRRLNIGVRDLVTGIEKSVVTFLAGHDIEALARADAPGVYVEGKKVAALGLRIRRGCSYHGLSLNVDMDLAPFSNINPCGFEGLEVTDIHSLGLALCLADVAQELVAILSREFGYDSAPLMT